MIFLLVFSTKRYCLSQAALEKQRAEFDDQVCNLQKEFASAIFKRDVLQEKQKEKELIALEEKLQAEKGIEYFCYFRNGFFKPFLFQLSFAISHKSVSDDLTGSVEYHIKKKFCVLLFMQLLFCNKRVRKVYKRSISRTYSTRFVPSVTRPRFSDFFQGLNGLTLS